MQPSEPEHERRVGRLLGGIAVLVIGLLILVPSGLCTAAMGYGALMNVLTQHGDGLSLALLIVGVGGPVMVGGAALVYAGLKTLRRR